MPDTSSINILKLGMQYDKHPFNLEKGEYPFLLNGTIEGFDGSGFPQIQNESSNLLTADNFPEGYIVIGQRYIHELERTIFFMVNPTTGQSEIGEIKECNFTDTTDLQYLSSTCPTCINGKELLENTPLEKVTQIPYCSYRTVQNDSCFNFNIDNPVDIEYRIFRGTLRIYFTDNLNNRRFIYFDINNNGELVVQNRFKIITGYDPDNCNIPIYSTHIDCNKISYNPIYIKPCIKIEDILFGGSLKAGTYQVLGSYADSLSNPLTKYFPATDPISIKTKNITIETNYITDKSLLIKTTNLDLTGIYTHYNIVIAETVDNFTTFKLVATLPITQNTYLYTGSGNNYKSLDANDIFFEYPIYTTAKSVTKANDYLFFSRLKENPKLNLQQAVNRMKIFWQTKAIDEGVYSKDLGSNLYRTYMRDEVYPIGIVFEIDGDNDTIAFPFVAPSKSYFQTTYGVNPDSVISTNDIITVPSCDNTILNKKWQSYNIAQIVGSPHQYSTSCDDDNCWEYGDFSYWESTDVYPNIPEIWGDLCGQPIRHFKFPDSKVTHIHDSLNGSKDFFSKNIVYPIGIKIDHASIVAALAWAVSNNLITAEQRANIKGYRIVRGNRVGSKSIVAKGLLYDMWNYAKNSNTYYYPNYPYNDLRPDKFIAPDDTTYDGSNTSDPHPSTFSATGRYTFHSPDVHFANYTLGDILKLETEEYGKSEGFFNHTEDQPKYRLLSTVSRTLAFGVGIAAAISSITKECRTIEKKTIKTDYIPNISGGSIVNTLTAGILVTASGTSGTSGNIDTHITTTPEPVTPSETPLETPTLKFQTALTPSVIVANKVTTNDCKGTTYQWLSPAHLAALTAEHPVFGSIMAGILALSGGISSALQFLTIMLNEINIFTDVLKALMPKKNLFTQYNSVGKYNNYKIVPESGNKVRLIDTGTYLTPYNQSVKETSGTIKINNWNRESSVFLKTSGVLLPSPTIVDDSKTIMSDANLGYNDLNVNIYRNISSYYGSIKNYIPNQYGSIYNIEYLETNNCSVDLTSTPNSCKTYFGGDIFITRFALKRKHPFFLQTRFKQQDESDVQYSLLGNAGYPNYYMDYGEGILEKLSNVNIGDILTNPGTFFQDLVGTDDSRMDAKTAKFFYQNGYIHLYSYGIPYFLVESDVNVDLRHGENNKEKDYYPNQQDLTRWFQENNVPITEDNYYFYNKTYSKQNKESFIKVVKPDYLDFTLVKNVTYDQRFIYTEATGTLNENDNWLITKANNFKDVDATNGKIISVDGIEKDKILLRTENNTQVYNAYDIIQTSSGSIQVGTGGIFQSRPMEFASTNLGYMGSQNKDMLKTEFGHIFVDAKRGNVFQILPGGNGIEEISRNGMRNWFKENLPFQSFKYIKGMTIDTIDNAFNDIGVSLCFDKRYSRMFLTKLDYKPIVDNVYFKKGKYYLGNPDNFLEEEVKIIHLNDKTYFKNLSWTISYNFLTKTWVSFHSFTPNYYIDKIYYFESGIKIYETTTDCDCCEIQNCSLWSHNLTNKSYQVYYGKLYPFTLEALTDPSIGVSSLNSISYISDVIRYHNKYDAFHNKEITFNKAIVYNDNQNSGQLLLKPKVENDFSIFGSYPNVVANGIEIEASNSQNTWNFNTFYDTVYSKTNNLPLWLMDSNNVDKSLNLKAFDYFRNDYDQPRFTNRTCKVRLTNDIYSNYHFIFFITLFNQNLSIR